MGHNKASDWWDRLSQKEKERKYKEVYGEYPTGVVSNSDTDRIHKQCAGFKISFGFGKKEESKDTGPSDSFFNGRG